MPALPSGIRAASPLNASDDSRLLFTADLTETLSRALDNTPTDFQSMDSGLQVQVEYSQQGRADDTLGLSVRIVNGATILAAASAGGTFQNVNANVTNTTDTTTTPTFGFVNTSADKTTWDGATIELQQTYGQNMGKDGCLIRVDTIQLVGNYTAATQQYQEDLSTTITATTTEADVAAFVEAFSGGDPIEVMYDSFDVPVSIEPWAGRWLPSQGPGGLATIINHSGDYGLMTTGSSGTASNDYARVIARPAAASADQEVLFIWETTNGIAITTFTVWLRSSGDWFSDGAGGVYPTDGYGLRFLAATTTASFMLSDGGTPSTVANSASGIKPSGTGPFYVRFRVEGTQLMAKFWAVGTDEPRDWEFTANDSTISAGSGLQIAYGTRANDGTEEARVSDLVWWDLSAPASTIVCSTDVLDRLPETNRNTLMAELSPIAWWKLGDSGGGDEVSNHDLTWSGSPTFSPAAGDMPISGGMGYVSLDPTNLDYATAANDADFELYEDLFIEVWVRPHSDAANAAELYIITQAAELTGSLQELFAICWEELNTRYEFGPTSQNLAHVALPNNDPEVNVWAHWVFEIRWRPSYRRVYAYFNGVRRIPNFDSHSAMVGVDTWSPPVDDRGFYIGARPTSGTQDRHFDGDIAEIAIFSGRIRPSQARDLAASSYGMSETLQTSITATTTSADTQAMAETLSTSIVASTTSADALAATEALTVSVVATTTEDDVLTFTETLSAQIVATVTEADTAAFTETLSTTVVATSTSADAKGVTETLSTQIVATTTSDDVYTPGSNQYMEDLSTTITATTTATDDLAMFEALTVAVVGTSTSADQLTATEALTTAPIAVVTSSDTAALTETLSTTGTVTTTAADQLNRVETLTTQITATTTEADTAALSETLSTQVVATTQVVDQMAGNFVEILSTDIAATTSSADQLAATEALTTSITAQTAVTDDLALFEALSTSGSATTAAQDALSASETLASTLVAQTTLQDSLGLSEGLSTSVVATSTVVDQLTQAEALATTGTVSTTLADRVALSDAVTTNIVATTTSMDQFTGVGGNEFMEVLSTTGTATTSTADVLAATESFEITGDVDLISLDAYASSETLGVSIVATTTSGDGLVWIETLAVNIVATVTSTDIYGVSETLLTEVLGSTTTGDVFGGYDALSTHIVGTTLLWLNKPYNVGASSTRGSVPPTDTGGEDRFTDAIGSPGPSKVSR